MQHLDEVRAVLDDSLGLGGGARRLNAESPLLGSLPELDSMAVIGLISALETRFDISVDDDEIEARHFATLGSLADFVSAKLAA
jgi:acyl carrier protein